MNTFYGKSVNEMNFNELTLLSVYIQLSSFEQVRNIPTHVVEQSYLIREGLMFKCMNDGGVYTREQFVNDFNGTRQTQLEGVYDEFTEVNTQLFLN
jgi:hypothetical protein